VTRVRVPSVRGDTHLRTVSTTTLYRPVGPEELALNEASGWKAFPPRLPEQPIFYRVTNLAYVRQMASLRVAWPESECI